MYPNNIFEKCDFDKVLSRVHRLTPESTRKWGKMDVAQMMAHCSLVNKIYRTDGGGKQPFFIRLFKNVIKKTITSTAPYKKNGRTAPGFVVSSSKSFEKEKNSLLKSMEDLHSYFESREEFQHGLFGTMPKNEVGWVIYKHLNHHLNQFGV